MVIDFISVLVLTEHSLVALSQGAIRHGLCRPQLTVENVVDVKGGRHLLQELSVPSYVANDTYLQAGILGQEEEASVATGSPGQLAEAAGPSMLIMTGPNYSGKSVYMKQVALIVYMAHVGRYVFQKSDNGKNARH
jgi:DNA mismatch repair protein MSH5